MRVVYPDILGSLSDSQLNQQLYLEEDENQQLQINKDGQVTLKSKAYSKHMQSLGYLPSILAHTHCLPACSAQAQHMLTTTEQTRPATPRTGQKRKVGHRTQHMLGTCLQCL
jgi:hypothetical protein